MLDRTEVVIIRPTRDRQCDNQLGLPMDYGGQTQCAFPEPVNQFSTSVGQSSRKKYFWYIYMKLPTNIDSSGPDSVLIHSCCIFVFLTSVTCSFSSELSSLRSNLFIQIPLIKIQSKSPLQKHPEYCLTTYIGPVAQPSWQAKWTIISGEVCRGKNKE